MTGFLVDTSVLLDLAESDPIWLDRSRATLEAASSEGFLAINPVTTAERSYAPHPSSRSSSVTAAAGTSSEVKA
jgi:predicted nucleic acid-binding protein